ncbi:hypothetical protein Mal64_03440 [Pseudobythopirellula maris]|uniref:Chromosome partition protein Smc n=1 Tax=Pseudobythopirellula maris TaxID=2527991 RepID=A0A5C5ZQY3_9BACT|nr:hypothetical protein [Pseudobythopirellula maris]TWT89962.1 hypothetical protein Mal64_03440 [Pseudobythopirellula maris]
MHLSANQFVCHCLSRLAAAAWVAVALFAAPVVVAQSVEDLTARQAELASRFNRLEASALQVADAIDSESPERAEQIRAAVKAASERAVAGRFDDLVGLMQQSRLSAAVEEQEALAGELDELLRMLLEDPREAQIEAERKRLEELVKELGRMALDQKSLRDRGAKGDAAERLAKLQRELADDAKRLLDKGPAGESPPPGGGESQEQGGPPSAPSSPLDKALGRLGKAEKAMRGAEQQLGERDPKAAEPMQREAQHELEAARREAEEALQQIREEEQQRRLVQLVDRLRRLVAAQIEINRETAEAHQDAADRPPRATEIAAAKLAEREATLVTQADGALLLLAEDGASVAFPLLVSQARDTMDEVRERLEATRLGELTQRLEQEVIDTLADAVEALDRKLEELEQKRSDRESGQPGSPTGEPELVAKIAELRLIRALQQRVLRRTEHWRSALLAGEETAEQADAALAELASRQMELVRATEKLQD